MILVPYALEPAWPHPFSEVDDLLAADSFGRLYLCTFSHLPFVPAGFSIFLGILYLRLSLGGGICIVRLAVRYFGPPACNKAPLFGLLERRGFASPPPPFGS